VRRATPKLTDAGRQLADRIRKKVKAEPGVRVPETRRNLTNGLRDAFEDGLDPALAEKW